MDNATQKLVDEARLLSGALEEYDFEGERAGDAAAVLNDIADALEAAQRPPVSPEAREEMVKALEEAASLPLGVIEDGEEHWASYWADALLARFSVPSQPVYDEEAVGRAAKAMWELRMRPTDPAWKDVDHGVRVEYEKDARAALVAALRGGELTREETNE